jgi:hypothetical protein
MRVGWGEPTHLGHSKGPDNLGSEAGLDCLGSGVITPAQWVFRDPILLGLDEIF